MGDRIQLEPGRQLGPYRIQALIGSGGMGDVYRARDTRLSRDVALKVLPPEVASDPERVRRFEQEARAIAALNHPNIVTLYSVEEADNLRFLTMELVEGTPLSEQIPRDGLPLERLLDIGVALTDGLATAHARGIVHRDLKPANVMVTPEGRVKILDFGLAKLKPVAGLSEETTTASPATGDGRLLGTVAYMSPEQAEGRDVDHRSDIFSLGVMLYELATGQRPFKGDSTLSLLSAILRDTPAFLTELKPEVPREFARSVRRCLGKDPERRYQSVKDVRNELEELKQEIASGAWLRPDSAAVSRLRRWRSLAWTAVGIGALAATAFIYLAWSGAIDLPSHTSPAAPLVSTAVEVPIAVPESVKTVHSLSVSPDGTRLAFAGGSRLWLYHLATREVTPITGIVGAEPVYPFWSPDGRFIAYFQESPGKLMKIPAVGGSPTKICDLDSPGRGGTWAANTIVFARFKDGLFRVSATGGVPVPITRLVEKGELGHLWPQFLPDGQHFIYMTFEVQNKVYLASLDSNVPRRLLAPAPGVPIDMNSRAFALSGFLLSAEGGILTARPLDPTGTEPAGEPESLAQDLAIVSTVAGDRLLAASPTVLAYVAAKPRRSQFSVVDRRNRSLRAVGAPVVIRSGGAWRATWSVSPNGQAIAFSESENIWLLDLLRSTPDRFTSGPGRHWLPVWSPNGDEIAFTHSSQDRNQDSLHSLHVKRRGSELDSRIPVELSGFGVAHDWHSNTLLFTMQTPTGVHNIWRLAIDGSRKPEPWFSSTFNHVAAQFSSDGQWVAYSSNETGAYEVYLRRFPSADRQVRVSTAGGNRPRWRPDGKGLFYLQGDLLMQLDLNIGETVRRGMAREVFKLGENCGYAVLRDGRFVVCRPFDPVPPPTITVRLNWAAGLKKGQ
jgi:serine/threonine protein kinase/Tol biopolymer transport system component